MELTKKITAIVISATLIFFAGYEFNVHLPSLEVRIESLGFFAPAGFVALFAVTTPLFISVDALCLVAGVLFPLFTGELAIILATYLSAAAIFFTGRHFVRDKVREIISRHRHLAIIELIIRGQNSFKLMFLIRLTPMPFAMVSYALSLTEVAFLPYMAATSGILLYNCSLVYLGYAAKHMGGALSGNGGGAFSHSFLVIGVIALLFVLAYIGRMAGKALNVQNNQDKVSQ